MTIDENSGASSPSASEYILDNFEPIDRIAMLVLNRDRGEVLQRITSAKKVSSPEFQAWLRYKNVTGSDIYIPEFQVKNIHYISFVPSEALG